MHGLFDRARADAHRAGDVVDAEIREVAQYHRLPFAPRLALRDLARYQARAAAAIAAITLGLGASVTIVVLAQANQYRADEGNLSAVLKALKRLRPTGTLACSPSQAPLQPRRLADGPRPGRWP